MLRVEPKPDVIDYRPKVIHVDASTLKQYVGEYKVQGVIIKIYTQENGYHKISESWEWQK